MSDVSERALGAWVTVGGMPGGEREGVAVEAGRMEKLVKARFAEGCRGVDVGFCAYVQAAVRAAAAAGRAGVGAVSCPPTLLLAVCCTVASLACES